ncbi:MAG: hypothetical protein HY553_01995 [Elusimicrobia bacterium]|nr:hypothetical protein [Elusimicrobiota bacterium]
MPQLITLFDEAEAARFPWPTPAPEAAEPTPAPRRLEAEPELEELRPPQAPAPFLGFGLTLLFWFGGATFFFITAIAIDMLIQLMR